MHIEFDHLEQGSMFIVEYEVRFYALSRYSCTNISTEFERICKFVKGLEGPFQLETTHMVVLRASF